MDTNDFINQAKADSISEHGTSVTIAPFAQTDVIQTITQGLTPDCQILYSIQLKMALIRTQTHYVDICHLNLKVKSLQMRLANLTSHL